MAGSSYLLATMPAYVSGHLKSGLAPRRLQVIVSCEAKESVLWCGVKTVAGLSVVAVMVSSRYLHDDWDSIGTLRAV
jgi:hypothetical protein